MTSFSLPCALPVVSAPMAGGPSTPELAAAVANAGGFGTVAAGYLTVETLLATWKRTRDLTGAPLAVNLFVPSEPADPPAVEAYRDVVAQEAGSLGYPIGEPRWDDDCYADKLALLAELAPALVTFTFGCPTADAAEALHRAGVAVGVTVTTEAEADRAVEVGTDLLIVQGTEAGGHQASFLDRREPNRTPLLDALAAVRGKGLPVVAAGGIMTGSDARAALQAGAIAVQLGTALLCTPEAATTQLHREALLDRRFSETVITRAFSGKWARGLRNRFAVEHDDAPEGYPEVHHLTRPMRAAAARAGDADVPNLWAGTGWRHVAAEPAADVVRRIARDLDA